MCRGIPAALMITPRCLTPRAGADTIVTSFPGPPPNRCLSMTIALVADIHGNRTALDAVLSDAHAQGVREFWFLGDFCAIGPEPSAVLERVEDLPGARFIRGNTDRYVVTGEGPPPHLLQVRADPDLISLFAEIAASMAWTRGYLAAVGRLDWLAGLPLETRFTTAEGVRILAVHASPGTDDGEGIHPGRSNAELNALLEGSGADLVIVGHTHAPMARRVSRGWVVNPGSVGNPHGPDPRASYAILRPSPDGLVIRHRRVPYDLEAFAEAVRRSRHPGAAFILSFIEGARPAYPPHPDHTPWRPDQEFRIGSAPVGRPGVDDESPR
ncbi:MAG: metallophosphoesterase [Gemmatimonadales bacterium]|nr:MAG: metallophosphoesterase [Gemmatimonadales bacterium]